MIDFLIETSRFTTFLTIALFVLSMLGIIVATVFASLKRTCATRRTLKWFVLPMFLTLFLGSFIWSYLEQSVVSSKVEGIFKNREYAVSVKGQILEDEEEFKRDFMNRKHTKMSGSSPVRPIRVRIAGETEEIALLFWRDSRDENFYWVEFPKFEYSASLFYVETETLDDF